LCANKFKKIDKQINPAEEVKYSTVMPLVVAFGTNTEIVGSGDASVLLGWCMLALVGW